ncbi:MAG TPA: phosphate ABC transporter permease PstA [Dictyoglomaceae bacterium]|nr:phosphate ABC transporter permease PstA [Dictyoglomaceae bacterium]
MNYRRRKTTNYIMLGICIAAFFIGAIFLFWILGDVFLKGIKYINWKLFVELPKPPGIPEGGFGNAILGTFILTILASIIGIPIGIMAGVYVTEYGSGKLAWWTKFLTEILSSFPTIIIGIFIYILIVVPMKTFSALSGGIALSIIMLPVIAKSTEESIKMIPVSVREASYALGVPKWRTILRIVIPSAGSGIVTGIMMSIARIMGETAPLLFTSLNNNYWSYKLNEPIGSLTVLIFNYATSPYEDWRNMAWAAALILVFIVLILNIIAHIYTGKREKR